MNHIHKLQNDLIERDRVLCDRLERTQEFRVHLQSDKFKNAEGLSRRDWISVADVQRWLNYIQEGN